jgi:tol-pal system protein YbgF
MKKILLTTFIFLSVSSLAFADNLPEASSDQVYGDTDSAPAKKLSSADQLAILARKVDSLQDRMSQMQELQAKLTDLNGRVEILEHGAQQLSDQVKQQYKDFDQRLQNTATNKSSNVASNERAIESPAVAAVDTKSKSEDAAYQAAFNAVRNKNYPKAAPLLQKYLIKYPNGSHAANAHYWSAEIHSLAGETDQAITEYQKIISTFPQSDKVQMAQLQLGDAYHAQGNDAKARGQYKKVTSLYPNTMAQKLAQKKLAQLSPAKAAN